MRICVSSEIAFAEHVHFKKMMHGTLNNRQWKITPNDGLKPVFFGVGKT
jgi:hypothetical protein